MKPWVLFDSFKQFVDVKDAPQGAIGFVYMITTPQKKKYIGQKVLYRQGKDKKGYAEDGHGKRIESDWKEYATSSKNLMYRPREEKDQWERTILEFAMNKSHLVYLELEYQFKYKVLEDSTFLNGCIEIHYPIYRRQIPQTLQYFTDFMYH